MNIDIDFSQASTKRGCVLVTFAALAFYKLVMGEIDQAAAAIAAGQTLAGTLGIILSDKT